MGISVALAIAGAASSILGGLSQASALKQQARFSEVQAERESIKGEQEGNLIKRELLERLAANTARQGASGLTPGVSFQTTQVELGKSAERELSVVRSNALAREQTKLLEASQARKSARGAIIAGFGGAAKSLLSVR